jgi:hypothetical protein
MKQGINLKIVQGPLFSPEFRDLALALATCPDDAAAGRAIQRYAPAVAGLLFATRDVEHQFSDELIKLDETVDKGVCPYFYLSQFALSLIESLDRVMEDRLRKIDP